MAAGCMAATALLNSCALDEPFASDGEGTLQMKLVINSDVTRAETDPSDLSANCVVYISGEKGLLHKFKGLENVPDAISLKCGHYVAEAWTGDSVSASFDKKFFRGYQPFDMQTGLNNVVVNCKIANVVVSVNPSTIDTDMMKDFNINVANSRASLDFTKDNYEYAKGYFMMPNADKDIKVTVTGTNLEGKSFTKTHIIPSVQRAHEYVLNFEYNPEYTDQGGAFVTINVDDHEVLVESEVEIFSRPRIQGVTFAADNQLVKPTAGFNQQILKVNAFGSIENFKISSPDFASFGFPEEVIDLKHCTEEVAAAVLAAGLERDETFNEEQNVVTSFLTLKPALLNRLPQRDSEYVLTLEVTDKYGKTTSQNLRFAIGDSAVVIDDPVTVEDATDPDNLMAILTTKATLRGSIVDATALNPGIRYRESGTTDWTFVAAGASASNAAARRHLTPAQALRAPGTAFSVSISGLKPATRYEYQACADGFESESKFFTTEGKFVIPNASFEEWGTYSAKTLLGTKTVVFPGTDRNDYFWDSGNEGAATANKQVLYQYGDLKNSGASSARLASGSAAGVIAAGNVFTGVYVKTDGTDGVLSLGRPYDGSHPTKVRVHANYRPGGSVSIKKGNDKYVDITSGGTDQGQIYVALTTAPIEIRTKASNRKLFPASSVNEDGNPAEDYDKVVAYGQVTWTGNFGADGALEVLDIPFTYHDIAKTTKPLYLVIVASASKFGDFYAGSASSVMILDDFELVYE